MHSAGEPLNIRAATQNGLEAMLQQWQATGRNPLLPNNSKDLRGPGWCWIGNNSGSNKQAFEVLSISDSMFDVLAIEHQRYGDCNVVGITPTNDPLYSYAILQEPCPSGGIARAVFSGITLASLTITHAQDMWCDVVNGVSTSLTTHCVGSSRIILKTTTIGSGQAGWIRIGDRSGEILVKNTTGASIGAGDSGTAAVWSGAALSETATGQTIDVYNRTSKAWANNKFGAAALLGGYGPYVVPYQT